MTVITMHLKQKLIELNKQQIKQWPLQIEQKVQRKILNIQQDTQQELLEVLLMNKKLIVVSMLNCILTLSVFAQETPRALSRAGGSHVGSQAYSSNSATDFEYAPDGFAQEHISGFWKGGYPNTSFNATRASAAPAVAPRTKTPQPSNPNMRDANRRQSKTSSLYNKE